MGKFSASHALQKNSKNGNNWLLRLAACRACNGRPCPKGDPMSCASQMASFFPRPYVHISQASSPVHDSCSIFHNSLICSRSHGRFLERSCEPPTKSVAVVGGSHLLFNCLHILPSLHPGFVKPAASYIS